MAETTVLYASQSRKYAEKPFMKNVLYRNYQLIAENTKKRLF